MMCLAVVCMYVIGAIGTPTSPTEAAAYLVEDSQVFARTTGDLQGKAGIGLMHRSGVFIEINHHSNIEENDRGYEHLQIGIVKSFPLWR